MRLVNILNINPRNKPLGEADVEAVVWPKLKLAKARHAVPNYWEVLVSPKDARESGLDTIAGWCARAVRDMYSREELPADGLVVACMLKSDLKIGRVRVECECLDQVAMERRTSLVRVSGAEVRGAVVSAYATQLWDGERVPVGQGVSIGRDPSCDIVICAEGISRLHGRIVPSDDGNFAYVDRSRNGSTVDGAPIHHRRVPLHNGSYIGLVPGIFIQVQW